MDTTHDKNTNVHVTNFQSHSIIPFTATVHSLAASLPIENEFIAEQASDFYSKALTLQTCHLNSKFYTDHSGFLIRKSAVGRAIQIVISVWLRKCTLNLAHPPSIAEHTGRHRVVDMLRRKFLGLQIVKDVFQTVAKCVGCKKDERWFKLEGHPQLFSAIEPLESVSTKAVWPLSRTTQGNQFFVVITDNYSKLMRAIQTSKTSSMHIANVFLKHWIVSCGTTRYLLVDDGHQFVSSFFTLISSDPTVIHFANTA